MMKYSWCGLWLVVLAANCSVANSDDKIDFARDVQPILANHCYTCHGPDAKTREAELRLDVRESAIAASGEVGAIVPGKPKSSELVQRIFHEDPDQQMPPASFKKPLSDAQKNTLMRWIEQGAEYGKHWAFESIRKPELPSFKSKTESDWVRNDLDRFVLAGLLKQNVQPSPKADRTTWLRRVTQDLTGLPPTVDQIDAFLNDRSTDAYETVVTKLLRSSDYAERMATIWLDNARYADSNGYQFDNTRKMWPWRDWVIRAYQKNMPFDQFVTEQLAGDLLPNATQDQRIATGFNRNHGFTIEGGVFAEEYRTMYVNDKTTTAGTVFLGLTLECCRCHDHKYDPLSTREYYSLFAFFNSNAEGGIGAKGKPIPPFVAIDGGNVMVMQEKPRVTKVLVGGQFDQLGEVVQPDTPAALPGFGDRPRNRLGLAQWLTASENPLLARVTVNRIWQQTFGVGLVKTVDNFGVQGEIPRHRELLDFLAADFRDNGWDLHHLIRTIVLSATYRQSSNHRPALDDPDNRLLARGPSFRLPAEMIRDQALAVSGLLVNKVGGPSVKPYQPAGIWEDLNAPKSHAEVYRQDSGESLYRKSMYTFWRRAAMHPAMAVFDAPNRDVCSVLRSTTNTPLQALSLMHDPIYIEAARKLAELAIRGETPQVRTSAANHTLGKTHSNYIQGVTIENVSSEYSKVFEATNVIGGKGLNGTRHGAISDQISWLNRSENDSQPQITFDLGKNYDLTAMHVWNYNESRRALSTRGVKEVEILIASDGTTPAFKSLGTFVLDKATGKDNYTGQDYKLSKNALPTTTSSNYDAALKNVRLVQFKIKSNHGGDLTGLSEVAFIEAQQSEQKTNVPPQDPATPKDVSDMDAMAAAVRHTLSRTGTARELKILNRLYQQRLAHYRTHRAAAQTLLAIGESRTDPALDPARVAAMADVCLAIFNLSETITRK